MKKIEDLDRICEDDEHVIDETSSLDSSDDENDKNDFEICGTVDETSSLDSSHDENDDDVQNFDKGKNGADNGSISKILLSNPDKTNSQDLWLGSNVIVYLVIFNNFSDYRQIFRGTH